MTVFVSNLGISNYKSCKEISIELSKYTPLIGYNNSGKSNVISALQWLLKKSVLQDADFRDSNSPVEVIAEINGIGEDVINLLDPIHVRQIRPYVDGSVLKIKRRQNKPQDKLSEVKISVWNPVASTWDANPTGIDNAIGKLLPEPIRIGAMEDAAEDASKSKASTTIGKLLAEFVKSVRDAHENDINEHLGKIEQQMSFDGANRLAGFSQIDESINSKINDLFPGIGLKLHFQVPTIDDLIKSGTVKVHEDGDASRDFSSYGHGTQRAIQMALIRHLAEVKRGHAGGVGTTLLLIDEPELYLHPFAIEHVREALKILSDNGYQIVFSTHSAQMVKSDDAENAVLIRKSNAKGTYSRRRLSAAIKIAVPDSIHQMEQLFTLSHASQMLFADKVVLTEGKTELRLLPFIFEIVSSKTLGQKRIALIAQSGVNDTKKSMAILEHMDLPCKAIVDIDYAFRGAIKNGFLSELDTDIVELKKIINDMGVSGQITVNPTDGLPKKGVVTAAEAFELIALLDISKPFIENLHNKLRANNIWLWKTGAIEKPLGLNSKDERAWSQFQHSVKSSGLDQVCTDHSAIAEMVAWLDG